MCTKMKKEPTSNKVFTDLKDYPIETHFVISARVPENIKPSDVLVYQLYRIDKIGKVGAAKKDYPETKEVTTLILDKKNILSVKDFVVTLKEFKEEVDNMAKYFNATVSILPS